MPWRIKTLEWLTTLTAERLLRAIFMILVFILFTMYLNSQSELRKTRVELMTEKEHRRLDERQRTDSFNYIINSLRIEYSSKYQLYLEEQLEKFKETNKVVTNTISKNAKIIKQIKER